MTVNGYEILNFTQHWRLIKGVWHRDVIARRLSDGELRLVSFRDES